MKYLLNYYIVFFVQMTSCTSLIDNQNYNGNDFRLFKNTPMWDLAKAVESENTEKIVKISKNNNIDLNFQEPKYGVTLLMLAVENYKYNSCKILLELGADPNIHDTYSGSTALIEAASKTDNTDVNLRIFKILLSHGANPHKEEIGERNEGNTTRKSPMLSSCGASYNEGSPLSKVELLVEAGVNINYKNEYNMSPLRVAIIHGNFDVVLYLLQKGVDYNIVISKVDNKEYFLWDELRFHLFDLNSKKYKEKMEVVDFLLLKGIDYRKTPIPEYAITTAKKLYPENWEEYIKKY